MEQTKPYTKELKIIVSELTKIQTIVAHLVKIPIHKQIKINLERYILLNVSEKIKEGDEEYSHRGVPLWPTGENRDILWHFVNPKYFERVVRKSDPPIRRKLKAIGELTHTLGIK